MFGKKAKRYKVFNSRRHVRLRAPYLVKYQLHGFEEGPHVANLKDLSEGGMRFFSREALPKGVVMEVSTLIPPDRIIKALGRVVYLRRRGPLAYHVAVSFIEVSKNDRKTLHHFIANIGKDTNLRRMIAVGSRVVYRNPS